MIEKIKELEDLQKSIRFEIESGILTDNGIYTYLIIAFRRGQIHELEKANKKMEAERVTKK